MASMREYWANEAAKMRDTSGVLGKEVLMPVSASNILGNTQQPVEQCLKTWDITDVWNVRSLELEKHDIDTESAWKLVKTKYAIAKREAEETIRDVGSRIPTAQKDIVSQLLNGSPWGYTIQALNSNLVWRQYALNYAKHSTLEDEHNQLIGSLTSSHLNGFKTSMREFKSELRKFIDKLKKYVDENTNDIGYNRFNQYYEVEQLRFILDKIPSIKFTTAEIKALNMQETGDFTNITIDGFKFKKDGLRVNINSSGKGILGLCQLPVGSAKDAIEWVLPDTRITLFGGINLKNLEDLAKKMLGYEISICLTATYIGYIVSKLQSELDQVSDCLDKKRMVFAGYNSGPFTVKKALLAFFAGNKGENLTWANTKFQECLKKETKVFSSTKYSETYKYPTQIAERLTFKK